MARVYKTGSMAEARARMAGLPRRMEANLVKALQETARYGHTQVIKTTKRAKPKIRASGTFESSWTVVKLPDGAVLGNSAKHAIFVEIGRRPGKRPPFNAIREWVYQKRLKRRSKAKTKRGRMRAEHKVRALVIAIQWKIARKGFKGRYPLKAAMPAIRKRASLEVRRALRGVKP